MSITLKTSSFVHLFIVPSGSVYSNSNFQVKLLLQVFFTLIHQIISSPHSGIEDIFFEAKSLKILNSAFEGEVVKTLSLIHKIFFS
jgi:hypothetical protein